MSFVNEKISPEDVKKYGIESVDKKFVYGGTISREWTRDAERDMYLRQVAIGREETLSEATWTLYWGGKIITLKTENLGNVGPVGGKRSGHKRLIYIDIPKELVEQRSAIIADLRDALVEYADGGIHRSASSYDLVLEINV